MRKAVVPMITCQFFTIVAHEIHDLPRGSESKRHDEVKIKLSDRDMTMAIDCAG